MLLAPDLHEDLIKLEGIAEASVFSLEPPGVLGTEFDAPYTDRPMADGNPALGQQILYVAGTQVELMVEPDGVPNDLGRHSMAFLQRHGPLHPAIVIQLPLTCQRQPRARQGQTRAAANG